MRFFRTLPGPGGIYELRNEGLTLALGFTLIGQLWQVQKSDLDLGERMTHLIDPIRFNQTIFSALLDAFSNLQNINDQRFEEFVEMVESQPT